jgi:CheY-like chemotaxis protein
LRILVVDDHFNARWAAADWLAVFLDSVAIESAASVAEALTLIKARKPDLVLAADPMTPIGGIELARRLKAQSDPPLMVVMTDAVDAQFESACAAAGADFWLEKRHLQARLLAFMQQRFTLRLAPQGFLP